MLKKLLATTVIFASSLSTALAGSLYIGPGLEWQNVSMHSNHYQGLSPKLSLGYGEWVNESFFMAGEFSGAPWSIDMNNEPKNGKSLKLKYSYAASVIPGFPLDEMLMIYGRVGYQYSRFQQLDLGKGGVLLGLGLGVNLTPCWDLRAEYNYIKYGSIGNVGKPSAYEIYVGGVYRFYTF